MRLGLGHGRRPGKEQSEHAEWFEDLFRSHYRDIAAFVLRRIHDRNLAEDITEEVFLVAWRRMGAVTDPDRAWLFGVARGVILNATRSERRRRALQARLSDEYRVRMGTFDDVPVHVPEREVAAALARLSEPEREILLLVAWEGFTQAEAARVIGVSPSTFSTRYKAASERFAAMLQEAPTSSLDAQVISS